MHASLDALVTEATEKTAEDQRESLRHARSSLMTRRRSRRRKRRKKNTKLTLIEFFLKDFFRVLLVRRWDNDLLSLLEKL